MRKIGSALAAVLAVLVTACGGPSVEDYASTVNERQNKAGDRIADIGQAITPESSVESDAATVDKQLGELDRLSDSLADIKKDSIPKGLGGVHKAYVSWVDSLDDSLRGFGEPGFKEALQVQTASGQRFVGSLNRVVSTVASSDGGSLFGPDEAHAAPPARAGGGGGGGTKPSGGGSTKTSGGSKAANNGGGGSKTTSASKPSSGSKTAPPVTKTVPPSLPPRLTTPTRVNTANGVRTVPPKVRVPAGRAYGRDGAFLRSKSGARYRDPYRYRSNGYNGSPMYYGAYDSPFFYIWLLSITDDDDSNDALPPSSDGFVDESLLSYLQILGAQSDLVEAKR
jgi:hypothetical protein